MDSGRFTIVRKALKKTQAGLADLLGVSVKAVRSYEQGWRKIPAHVERQMYFLISRKEKKGKPPPCWVINRCPSKVKKNCPAWEYRAGDMCWLIHGTQCRAHLLHDAKDIMSRCRKCRVIEELTPDDKGDAGEGDQDK
ncbi:MAG: helix-turn-helix domain-containing protein [Desulfatibacillum sp.]|nr:helix-turn-helix domain-containing protein [Desulfatibacillum sp.]